MASRREIKTVPNARSDFISKLPADVKDRILECLSTPEAARTALLSTHWRDVWLQHGRLAFDLNFLRCVTNGAGNKERVDFVKIVTYILMFRARPVKKFILMIVSDLVLEQSDLDQWALYLTRNGVEELSIYVYDPDRKYKLPSCIVSCPTIKQLTLHGFIFDWPINARCIFPSVTSLVFEDVEFNDNLSGIVSSIPNLEKLVFHGCEGNNNFEINTPQLESLSITGYMFPVVESRWFTHCFKGIKVLCLCNNSLSDEDVKVAALTFPTAINLQVLKLYHLSFANTNQLTVAMQLLKKSPNLCKLEIIALYVRSSSEDIEVASRLLEDPNGCNINQDLNMLKTVKIEWFGGSAVEMLFVKILLSKSPVLERLVLHGWFCLDASIAVNIPRELLLFPRASKKAQIVWMEGNPNFSLVDYPQF